MGWRSSAIVIGGGPAGLLASAHLAAAGMATVVLESKARFGGRASSQRHDALSLNQGPHALYLAGAALRELRVVGIDPPGWNRAAGQLYIHNGELRRDIDASEALQRWRESAAGGRSDEDLATTSVSEWLDASLDGVAREAAAALVRLTTFVADHDHFSADVAAMQLRNARSSGVRYLEGGWQALVDELAAQAKGRGVTLRTRAAVRALREESGRWTVSLADEELCADAVIVAVGGHRATTRLLGRRTPPASGPPVEVSTLDIGMRNLPEPTHRFALAVDRPAYLGHYSPPDQRSPQLQTAVSYSRGPLSELEAIFDLVQPGWRDEQILHRHLPRMTPSSALTTPGTGGLAGRPGVEVQPGLYVAGDWVGPEGWLCDASLASAAAAARAAIAARAGLPAPA
jgi:2-polyprenyl-6-methoxyphenol hydroxylase-like FAD-dependent oxidoreductase